MRDNYEVIVNCRDVGSLFREINFIFFVIVVDENDNFLWFERKIYNVNILENNDIDISFLVVFVIDDDIGVNVDLRYFVLEEV